MWEIAYNLHFHLNNWKKLHQFSELRCQIEIAPVMVNFYFTLFWGACHHVLAGVFDESLINCNWQSKTKKQPIQTLFDLPFLFQLFQRNW